MLPSVFRNAFVPLVIFLIRLHYDILRKLSPCCPRRFAGSLGRRHYFVWWELYFFNQTDFLFKAEGLVGNYFSVYLSKSHLFL